MSLILIAALALAAPNVDGRPAISAADRPAVAVAARRMNVPVRSLYRAMTDRVSPRRAGGAVRYCITRERIVAGTSGAVCRTRAEWASYNLMLPDRRG